MGIEMLLAFGVVCGIIGLFGMAALSLLGNGASKRDIASEAGARVDYWRRNGR